MPRPLSSYFTSSPSSSAAHSRTRSHSNVDGLLPSHAPPPDSSVHQVQDSWVVPVSSRAPSWDLERNSWSPVSSSSHTLLHLGPTPSRSLSLGRAPGLSPATAAASRSYRQAGLIEQGLPAAAAPPPPPPLSSSSSSTSPPTKPQWPPQQPLTPTSHHLPSHRQTRSVGRAAPPPPPPPPLASSSHVRVPSTSRHSHTTMLGHHDPHQHARPRANSNSRPPMAYSPLAGGSSAPAAATASPGGQPRGRRADPAGGFVSPLKALTTALPQTYHLVNPAFVYETSRNPRRVLTKPSKPAGNEGFDNEDSDYILYVNDVLGPEDKDRYLILDVLGQGTFGQVVKCQNMKTHEIVAVKVVKNKPAYFQQSMMEVTILELVNNQWDKDDEHHMLRLKDTFIHHSHLCLVFELLSNNLYELIKQNSFRGLSTSLVRVFTAQLLDALSVLNEAKIIHCDLKPENILLKSLQSPTIKVIDFGSACHEKQTVYTYIQSRFYRSPEVILSLPYSSMIDMWSLGCICVELFLGLPLFPGTSEFNQITRIVEMLGMPPDHMLDKGKQTSHFFETVSDEYGRRRYRLKSLERYASEYKANEQPSKKYFSASTLPEIVKQYPIVRKGLKEAEVDKEMINRLAFIDFVQGLLNLDPEQRWSPQQARLHPFVLGEPLLAPFVPPPRHLVTKGGAPSPTDVAQAKQQQQQAAMMRAQQQQQQQQAYGAPMQQPQTPRRAQYGQPMPPQLHTPQQPQQSPYGQAQAPRGQYQPFDPAAAAAAQQQQQHQQHQQALAQQAAQQPSLYGAAAGG
ncbi:uncharacterized protein RHOBADRAFT_33837, partial [Rhodotorula graminis WP1]